MTVDTVKNEPIPEYCFLDDGTRCSKGKFEEGTLINNYEMILELAPKRYEYERHDYTVVALLADFGGFNDGLLLLVSAITGLYSQSMFQGKFASMFPTQKKPNKNKRQSQRKRT